MINRSKALCKDVLCLKAALQQCSHHIVMEHSLEITSGDVSKKMYLNQNKPRAVTIAVK